MNVDISTVPYGTTLYGTTDNIFHQDEKYISYVRYYRTSIILFDITVLD